MNIRDSTPDDYHDVAAIRTAIYPDLPVTVEDWQENDAKRDPKCKHRRWVAELDDHIVAFAIYDQSHWEYHPQKFQVLVRVLPEFQGRGIGSRLYDLVIDALQPHNPIELSCNAREDHASALDWIKRRGFAEHLRDQWSELDVTAFDPTPFAEVERRLNAQGIVIKSYTELGDDPERDRKLYEFDRAVLPDVPGTEDFTLPPFERWREDVLQSPNAKLDAYNIALDGDQFVGVSNIWGSRGTDTLFTGLTGIRREYRRKGIATALKVRVIQWAQTHGHPRIKTENEENNPMLQLNYRLGFQPTPAWVSFKKQL